MEISSSLCARNMTEAEMRVKSFFLKATPGKGKMPTLQNKAFNLEQRTQSCTRLAFFERFHILSSHSQKDENKQFLFFSKSRKYYISRKSGE